MYDMMVGDFIFEVTCRETQDEISQVGIIFSGTPEPLYDNYYWYTGYGYTVSTNTGSGLYLFGRQDPNVNFVNIVDWTQNNNINWGIGAWNTLKVMRTGGNVELYVNGVSLGSWFDNTYTQGYIGICMKAPGLDGYAEFKDFSLAVSDNESRAFKHFKVYRNGAEVATTSNQSYVETLPGFGTYNYQVSAVYDEGESETAGPESVTWQGGSGTATLSGIVFDATNDDPIEGATVTVAGKSDITDAFGAYNITDLPAGVLTANFAASPTTGTNPLTVQFNDLSLENAHTVFCDKAGYLDYENPQVEIPDGAVVNLDIPLSPQIVAGQMRMVLSWGEFPEDLDAHLLTPEIEGQKYEVFFDEMGSASSAPYALLDNDDTDGFGPETVTIYQKFSGTYKYFIFNYNENASITVSNAVVKIYDDSGLLYNINVPASGDGYYWYVCDINGANGNVTIRNQILDNPPPPLKAPAGAKTKESNVAVNRNIDSWSWDFGDGGTSTSEDPSHTYTTDGVYNVQLTVGSGSALDSEIKYNYIIVGESSIGEEDRTIPVIYPNPATNTVNLQSDMTIHHIKIISVDGKLMYETTIDEKQAQIDVSKYAEGNYMLWYEAGGEKGVTKLVISR
jgi:PKD repeat protein